jgi:RND family efflux transporter MFP subunit
MTPNTPVTRNDHAEHREPEPPEDLGFALPPPSSMSRTRVIAVVAIAIGAAFVFGWTQRSKARNETPLAQTAGKLTRVEVMAPRVVESDREMTLPGTVRALEQTKIYPRVTGYVRKWLVDLGDKVAAGQLLVEIDVPDLDAQLSQARAQLAQAQAAVNQVIAQRNYSKSNTQRIASLADQKLVSQSQVEQTQAQASTDEASVASAQSNVVAQQANVRRLIETQAFSRVVAPFAGRITSRSIERGDLVSETKTTELYTLAAIDPVRVLIDVPQTVVANVHAGSEAVLSVREFPGRKFTGKVTRSAGALDPDLHTMATEVQVPNPDGTLLPGMYVQATLSFPVPHRVIEIPATALYSDSQGLRVGVVDHQQKLHYVPITIERDTGATLLVATGLSGDERLVKIAVPGLPEGEPVESAEPPQVGSAAPAAGSTAPTPAK